MRLLVLISVVSDIILRISVQEPLLIFKKIVVLLHTLSTYNSLLIHYRVCLCTSWRHGEAYENFSIDIQYVVERSLKKIKLSYQVVSHYY